MPPIQKILVVDSDEHGRQLISFHLREEGYIAEEADAAEAALQMELAAFSLIIVDSALKKMNGLRFTSLIKGTDATAHIPLIICSAKGDSDSIIAGFNAGADDYIVKPISPRTMIARVRAILRRSHS